MIKKILIAIVALIIAIVGFASTRPDSFSVTRLITVNAPAAAPFALMNDFHKWQSWSPWAKMDPNAKNEFSGAASGVGAVFSWVGNSKVGEGKMTITESTPGSRIRLNLEFIKPFVSTAVTEFLFTPTGNQTTITWTMTGKANLISKIMGLFMDCDKMVGSQFEIGLAEIKTLAEAAQ